MSIQEVMHKAGVQEVTISGWNGDEVVVKLRRPSLTGMIVGEFIPNPLLKTVEKLFRHRADELAEIDSVQQAKALHCIAAQALVEPTMEQLEKAGAFLTDEQYMEIYAFAIGGAASLARFRAFAGSGAGWNVAEHAGATQRIDGDQPSV